MLAFWGDNNKSFNIIIIAKKSADCTIPFKTSKYSNRAVSNFNTLTQLPKI